jgi:hypothetical protein
MPIEKVSATQFAEQITTQINDRAADIDTAYGPVPDTCIQPQSVVLETQNDRARQLSLMLSLSDASVFDGFEVDLEGIVYNEGETRSLGSGSTTTVVFFRSAAPTADLVVQRGYPVGTLPDESTGSTISFFVSEAKVLPVASASSYYNNVKGRYELSVPVLSLSTGAITRVGPERISTPLRPLGGFDGFTNPAAATGGLTAETNQALIDRYFLGVVGRQTGTASGIERLARARFPDVRSMDIVYGADPLLTRAATDAGAVDAWIQGSAELQLSENIEYLGLGQLLRITNPPLVSVISVASGGTTYVEGTDYEVVFDDTGVSRSVRESSGVRFIPGGSAPAVGAAVNVTYTYEGLIRNLQSTFETPDLLELGRDLLFRRGIDVPIVHTANLRVRSTFSVTAVLGAVRTAVLTFVNALGMGEPVEASDIQGVVRALSGVDNYVITRNTRSTEPSGTGDIAIGGNEFATLADVDLTVTVV